MSNDHNRLVEQQSVFRIGALAAELGYLFRLVKDHDKGIDAEIEISQSTDANIISPIIGVQIKGRTKIKINSNNEITINVTEQNLQYWRSYGRPVILITYLGSDDKVYWTRVDNATDRTIRVSLSQKFDSSSTQHFIRIISLYYNHLTRSLPTKELSELLTEIGPTAAAVFDPVEKKIRQAEELIEGDKYTEAIEIYSWLSNIFEEAPSIWFNWATCVIETKDYTKAHGILSKIIRKFPQDPDLLALMGVCLASLERFEEAESYFSNALKQAPLRADIWNSYGLMHYWQGRNKEAMEEILVAISYRPNDEYYYFNQALCLTALGDYESALKCYDKCISLRLDFYDAYINKAVLLKELWRFWEALDIYDKAIYLNPDKPAALCNSAYLLKDLGYNERAIQRYHRSLETRSDIASTHSNLGLLYCRLEEFSKAAFHFNKADEYHFFNKNRMIGLVRFLDLGYTVSYAISLEYTINSVRVIEVLDLSDIAMLSKRPDLIKLFQVGTLTNSPDLNHTPKDAFTPRNRSKTNYYH